MAEAGKRMALRAEPIVLPIAEAAIDVDKPEDLEMVTGILERREGDAGGRIRASTDATDR